MGGYLPPAMFANIQTSGGKSFPGFFLVYLWGKYEK